MKKGLDNSSLVGAILMDLSKAYEYLPCDLLITKLEAYSLDKPSLNLVNGYLCFRKQSKKIGSSHSDWANVTRGFSPDIHSRASILFIEKSDTCKFADNNTLFSCGDNMKILLRFKFIYSISGKVSIYDFSEIPTIKILSYNRAN